MGVAFGDGGVNFLAECLRFVLEAVSRFDVFSVKLDALSCLGRIIVRRLRLRSSGGGNPCWQSCPSIEQGNSDVVQLGHGDLTASRVFQRRADAVDVGSHKFQKVYLRHL